MEHTHTHTHKEDWAFFVCVVIRHQVAIFRRQILFRKNGRSCCLQMNSKITKETSTLHFLSFLPVSWNHDDMVVGAHLSSRFLTHALAQYRSVNKNSYAPEHSRATGRFVTGFRAPFFVRADYFDSLFFPLHHCKRSTTLIAWCSRNFIDGLLVLTSFTT
jgi:hypothetical protein